MEAKFKGFGSPVIRHDRAGFRLPVHYEGGEIDLLIPTGEVGNMIAFLIGLNEHLLADGEIVADRTDAVGPLQLYGIGLHQDARPEDVFLFLDLAGCRMAFRLGAEHLRYLSDGLPRAAKLAMAGPSRPN